MSCGVGSTNVGYLVTSSDNSIACEIGGMECDRGRLCLCKLPSTGVLISPYPDLLPD